MVTVPIEPFDSAGRLLSDAATVPAGSGVDSGILRIEMSYDSLSRVSGIASYSLASGGTVINDVHHVYDGWGNITRTYENHDGPVDDQLPGLSLYVDYTYDDGAVGNAAKYVRLSSVTYPDGRVVYYNYSDSGVGAVLSRLDNVAEDSDGDIQYAHYSYLGAGTITALSHPDPVVDGGLKLDYDIDGDDTLIGWDRFGRVIQQKWTDDAGTTTLDHYTYTYDRNGNRENRINEIVTDHHLDESYGTYDGLDRLTDSTRGGSNLQSWELDALGNWDSTTTTAGTEEREYDEANQISNIVTSGVIDPEYDPAGNMISGPKPGENTTRQYYVYDAWNRLVEVQDSSNDLIASYEYDGRNYRIEKVLTGTTDVTFDYYYNDSWQVVEVRKDAVEYPLEQYVWDIRYVDAPVVRWHDLDNDGYFDDDNEILYYTNDANMNVTALVNTDGDVAERYVYDPYGKVTVLNGAYGADPDVDGTTVFEWDEDPDQKSDVDNAVLYTGQRFDGESALYLFRNRYHDPSLGRFISRDPVGYLVGMSLYDYADSRPNVKRDPSGLRCWSDACTWGDKDQIEVTEVRFRPALRGANPGAVGAAERAVKWTLRIGTVAQVGQVASATALGLTKATLALTDVALTRKLRNFGFASAILEGIKGFEGPIAEAEGLAIWVGVKYKFCEWDPCWCWWWGYNDWVDKEAWHQCSAEGDVAGSKGLSVSNTRGILAAIPGCIKEAVESLGK
jgi:RHS repeat-associated protein